jgi:predicted nucleic acid-binding protein
MTFADLQAGDSIFVDANTLVYHCTLDPTHGPACTDLLDQIGHGVITGFTSTHILSEVAHRLMTLEASRLLGRPLTGMAYYLNTHPAEIQRLSSFRKAIEDLSIGSLRILIIPTALVVTAAAVSQQVGLLTNDALVVAIMQANGLTKLASNDIDFDRVPGLTRYAPT